MSRHGSRGPTKRIRTKIESVTLGIEQTFITRAIRVVAGMVVLLVVAYVLFMIYRVYFYDSGHSSSSNNSTYAIPMIIFTSVLAGMTVEFARSVWRRSLGVHSNRWKLRAFAVILIVFPVIVSPFSPTTLIFALLTGVLIFLNSLFYRSFVIKAAK